MGAAHHPGGSAEEPATNVKGYVRGFDVKTGKRLWIFHTIPRPGEFGYDTWEKDSADYTGNTGVWGQISVDEDLGIGLPARGTADRRFLRRPPARQRLVRRKHRRGGSENRQAQVALSVGPSRHLGHGHSVRADAREYHVNGQPVKALAQPTKQAFLYVFDRVTGKPIWPIEERPVEQTTVPGEKTSPRSRFRPSRRPTIARDSWTT